MTAVRVAPYRLIPHPPLPPEVPMHVDDVIRHLDSALRRCAAEGWYASDDFPTPYTLATAIACNARMIGANVISRLALLQLVPGLAQLLYQRARDGSKCTEMVHCDWTGASRAQQAAEQAVPIEVVHVAIKRALYAGATWTCRIYCQAITSPIRETAYGCTLLLDNDEPSGQCMNLLDVFGREILAPDEHVLVLRQRLVGLSARAVTRDDFGTTTRLLRSTGYPRSTTSAMGAL